jgi:Tol biopolymer transport system component
VRYDDGNLGASWSPDGRRIAFVHGVAGNEVLGLRSTLYTMNLDGGDVRRLLGHSCNPRTPEWSPSGKYLLFACDDGVYYMRAKGGSLRHLVGVSFRSRPISVSIEPDGRSLAFGWFGLETFSLTKNENPKVLTYQNGWEHATIDVAWAPSGKKLAFSVTGSGSGDGLYVIDRDGSQRRLLVRF